MRKYVIIYAYDNNQLIMVEKDRPSWQYGKLNMIGGSIEKDEEIIEAAIRELKEEAGLKPSGKATILGCLQTNDVLVWAVKIPVEKNKIKPRAGETELPIWMTLEEALKDIRLIPNLNIILPLMAHNVIGWTLNLIVENDFRFLLALD